MSAFGTTVPDCLYPEVPEVRRVGINTNDTNEAMKADVIKGVDVDNDPKSNPTNDDNTSNIDNTNSIRDKNSTTKQPNNHTCFACEKLRQQFADWRNAFTISDAKQRCRLVRPGYSCGVYPLGDSYALWQLSDRGLYHDGALRLMRQCKRCGET